MATKAGGGYNPASLGGPPFAERQAGMGRFQLSDNSKIYTMKLGAKRYTVYFDLNNSTRMNPWLALTFLIWAG